MTVIPCHTSTNSAVWRKAARWLMLRALLKVMTHFVYLKEYFQGQPLSIAFSQWYTQFASPWTHSSSADYLTLPEEEDFHSAGGTVQLPEEPPATSAQPHMQWQEAVSTRLVSQEKAQCPWKKHSSLRIFLMHIQGESIFLMMLENKPYTSNPIEIGRDNCFRWGFRDSGVVEWVYKPKQRVQWEYTAEEIYLTKSSIVCIYFISGYFTISWE